MRRREAGVTLVELLVTLALLGVATGLISQFFVLQSRSAAQQRGINEANENTRVALALVTWDVQSAGYRVSVSDINRAITPNSATGSYTDHFTTRYLFVDETAGVSEARKVRYDLATSPPRLRRAEFKDTETNPPGEMQPAVENIVALNLRYETRDNQFVTPSGSTCPSGTTPIVENGVTVNCSVNWVEQNDPLRLVRRVRVQVLARSSGRVPSYSDRNASYTFAGGGSYPTEPGYVYHFAEQTVVVENLSR